MPFTLHGYPITCLFQIIRKRLNSFINKCMIRICTRLHWIKSCQQTMSGRGAHSRSLKKSVEFQTFRCNSINIRSYGIRTPIATEIPHTAIISYNQNNIGKCILGYRGYTRKSYTSHHQQLRFTDIHNIHI